MTRYQRQLALPEITAADQQRLQKTRILVVGAGGLGAPALPYLAGAGIGHIIIADHDNVDISNLHRQTIYKEAQAGQNKAELAAQYIRELNPSIEVTAIAEKITEQNAEKLCGNFDLILDGSDNFATKYLLNEIAIKTKIPLISASVEQFAATAGIFAGHIEDQPCYACLFPQAPENACNCNDAGVLGTTAGLAGMYQAHLALCFLLGIGETTTGTVLALDLKNFRLRHLNLQADPNCKACANRKTATETAHPEQAPVPLLSYAEMIKHDHVVIDVRSPEEAAWDPLENTINIPLPDLMLRMDEIPRGKLVALVCGANIRSRAGAEMLRHAGLENVCVLDRASLASRAA